MDLDWQFLLPMASLPDFSVICVQLQSKIKWKILERNNLYILCVREGQ